MSFKDILVHVDGSDGVPDQLALATELARTHGAHLSGLYVIEIPAMPMYVQSEIPAEIIVAQRKAYTAAADDAGKVFQETTGAAGIGAEWRCAEDNAGRAIAVQSRYTDLVVLGHAAESDGGYEEKLTERVILESAKPVLVVPPRDASAPFGQRILVAWNTSRESVRAIDGAMPLLSAAPEVDVLAVNPHSSTSEHGPIPSVDICHHLARHGVKAEARELKSPDRDVGEALLKWAADQGCDLIVMGAYGRWRIREIVLGGVTKHVLKHTTIPVLLVH